jgi:hypothetical protein
VYTLARPPLLGLEPASRQLAMLSARHLKLTVKMFLQVSTGEPNRWIVARSYVPLHTGTMSSRTRDHRDPSLSVVPGDNYTKTLMS